MQLRAEKDPVRPIGHARIPLDGVTAPTELEFIIRREGYAAANLGRAGWQVREERLKPLAVEAGLGGTALILGPAITRHLEAMPYIFQIPGHNIDTTLFWPDDIDFFDGELQDRAPPEEPETPRVACAAGEAKASPREPESPQTTGGERTAEPPPPLQPMRRRWLVSTILTVLLSMAGAAAAWYWSGPPVGSGEPPPNPSPPPTSCPEGIDQKGLGEIGRSSPACIFAVAERRRATGKHDEALQLYEEAADKGYAPAMTALARLYDPIGFVPGRPFRTPDPLASARYYKEAVVRGEQSAVQPRQTLRDYLENEARAGNSTAITALKDYWP